MANGLGWATNCTFTALTGVWFAERAPGRNDDAYCLLLSLQVPALNCTGDDVQWPKFEATRGLQRTKGILPRKASSEKRSKGFIYSYRRPENVFRQVFPVKKISSSVMAAYCLEALLREEMTKVIQLNDLAVEHWIRRDFVATEQILAKAIKCLNELCRDSIPARTCGQAAISTKGTSLMFRTATIESSAADVYNRAFLLDSKSTDVDEHLGSLDAVAAVIFYNAALYYHLQEERRNGADSSRQEATYGFIVRYYEQADRLFARYMECTRRPLWLFQAALWNNIGKCYQQRTIGDSVAVYVYVEQVKAIVEWIETSGDRAFFKSIIFMMQLQHQQCAARAA